MTVKKLDSKSSPKTSRLTITPDPDQPLLRFREGWFFGMGFFTAAFVFSFVIVPAIGCMAFIALSILGISLG